MTIPISEASEYLFGHKKLIDIHPWRHKGKNGNTPALLCFESRVGIFNTLPRGLWFRISVIPSFNNGATFQLEIEKPDSRSHLILYRMEWRPLTGHNNGMRPDCPEELRGLIFAPGQSHEHVCTDCVITHEQRLSAKGVKSARKIEPEPFNYDAALRYVCGKLNIQNWGEIPASNAQNELF